MINSIFSRWRTMASAQSSAPTSVDPSSLARGAEIEEYNLDSHEKAVGVALQNLKKDPGHYGAVTRRWFSRLANTDLSAFIPRILASYKKDRDMGLDHGRSLDHSMGNWQMSINMRRSVAEQPELTEQEIATLRQSVEQAIASEGGGGNTAPDKWVGAAKKKNPDFEKETEKIKLNKEKPEAKKPHDFKPAKWTHPNGHPRCLVCGAEEIIGGRCNVTPTAKDYADFEKELDAEFPDRAERRKKNAALLNDRFERGEITHTDLRRCLAMTYESEVLLAAYYAGKITQTDLDQRLRLLRTNG